MKINFSEVDYLSSVGDRIQAFFSRFSLFQSSNSPYPSFRAAIPFLGPLAPWQFLYFLPLPHGHGSLRAGFLVLNAGLSSVLSCVSPTLSLSSCVLFCSSSSISSRLRNCTLCNALIASSLIFSISSRNRL